MQACRLSAHDLACRRGDRVLLAGVNLSLAPGDALQLGGANGIGKSSLLRVLAGLDRAFAGSVEREGAAGLVDERPALDPQVPLGRALGFWARLDGTPDPEAIAARLGIDRLLDIPFGYLSTGQKKRAALARLLGQAVPVWLLDEPLNGLDKAGAALVEELVGEHCGAGGIALIASHQPLKVPGLARAELAQFALAPSGERVGRGGGARDIPLPPTVVGVTGLRPPPEGEGELL